MSGVKGSAGEPDFFISYTQVDRAWAEWIGWVLEEDGHRVLIQAWDFVPGSNWILGMQAGARDADRTIAVLSPAYLESVYGGAEWQAAIAGDPDGTRRKLLVVRVARCERPGLLAAVVGVDLFGIPEADAKDRLRQMVAAAEAGRMKPSAAPSFPGPTEEEPTRPDLEPALPAPIAELRRPGPAFYLSYAQTRGGSEQKYRLFDDLSADLSQLLPRTAGQEPGFMNRDSRSDNAWTEERLQALGTSQVFVALLSGAYFSGSDCGMEWHAFARRTVRERGNLQHSIAAMTCILPVVWAPFDISNAPPTVQNIQWWTPSGVDQHVADHYRSNGLYGLMLAGPEQAYQAVTWSLAMLVARMLDTYQVDSEPIDTMGLRDAFGEPAN